MGLLSWFHKKEDSDEFSLPSFDDASSSSDGSASSGSIPGLPSMHEREKDLARPVPPAFFDVSPSQSPSSSASAITPPGSAPVSSFNNFNTAPPVQQQGAGGSSGVDSRDIQLLAAKLDLVKTAIDRLSEKVDEIEKKFDDRTNVFKGRW